MRARAIFGWAALSAFALVLLGILLLLLADTQAGRNVLARQLYRIAPESGLRVEVGRLEGSIYGDLIIHDLKLSDPQGIFLTSPRIRLDWHPRRFLFDNILDIDEASAARVDLLRIPELRPGEEDGPLLPDFDIDVDRVHVQNLVLAEAVAGESHRLSLNGNLLTKNDRARVALAATSPTGGDHVQFLLDAVPDADRFVLEGQVRAPPGGVLDDMTGLGRGLLLNVDGKGRWSHWRGTLVAQLLNASGDGNEGAGRIASLGVDAVDGRFRVTGQINPALLAGGMVERMAPNGVRIDASAAANEERIPFILQARADSFSLDARGATDRQLGNLFDAQARIALLDPPALIRTLTGRDIWMQVSAEGPLTGPEVGYELSADWAALGDQRVDQLTTTGRVHGSDSLADFTLDARFDRLRGAGDLVEQLSERARISGPLTLDDLVVRGSGTKATTRMLSATANFALDLQTGRFDVRTKMNLPAYQVPGLGVAAVDGRLRLQPDPAQPRKLRISGPVNARLTRLDNEFLRFVFGGLPRGEANIVRTPDGTIALSQVVVRAPELSMRGSGYYRLGQQIEFSGRGVQERFGDLAVTLNGDIGRPRADVVVDNYSLGLPISNISGTFIPAPDQYDFTARGSTILGPLTATGAIDTRPGQIRYLLQDIELAGVKASGVLTPTDGVPVTGTLAISGSGVDGTARFSEVDDNQRIVIAAGAKAASFDLDPSVGIRRGSVLANLLITPDGNRTDGRFDLAGLRFGALTLSSAQGKFDLAEGGGRISGKVEGRRGTSFALNMNAEMASDRIAVLADGDVGGAPISLESPARITRREGGGWSLAPVTLDLPRGDATIEGSINGEAVLNATFRRAGLEVLQLALPDIPLSGIATGEVRVRFAPGTLPRGRATFEINDFTRQTGILAQPVDIAMIAVIDEDSAAIRAAFKQDGRPMGRFQARLPSIPGAAADPVLQRIARAPVSAQLRFRGPAEAIWPLAGIDTIGVGGPLAARIDIGGTVGEPDLQGALRSRRLGFESVASGTVIEDIVLEGRFDGSRLVLDQFSGRDRKGGTVTGSGTVDLSLSRGFPIDVRLQTQDTTLVDIDTLETRVTGPITIKSSPEEGARIAGDLNVDRASYTAGRELSEQIPVLKVREVNSDLVRAPPQARADTTWQLDVQTTANNRLYVRGLGLDSEWSSALRLGGPVTEPRLTGTARLLRGDYDFAGRRFELTSGEVRFGGAYPPDPVLNIRAEARVEGLTAQIAIRGLSSQPEVTLSSVPALPEDEILARVLFGTSIPNLSAPEALQLAGAVAALQNGGTSALDPIGAVRRAIGIDRLRISAADAQTGRGTGVAAGEYLGRRTYVEVSTDTEGVSATQIEFALTRAFSLLGRVASFGGSSVAIRVSTDY
ncbi:translocation/assembly module TamB domain-containing protein [Pacificimonas sp. ICDLI1SI03]